MFNRMRNICFGSVQRWRVGCAVLAASAAVLPSALGQEGGLFKTLGGTGVAGYSEGPHGISEFHTPVALAVRKDGYLFIADRDNNVVRQMSLATTNTAKFVSITQPVGLAFDSKTNLFIASGADGSIAKYDYFKNYRQTLHPTLTAGPITALAIDRDDNLYLAEQGGVVIQIDANGNTVASLSAPTAGAHEFRGVAVTDDGIVFVSDAAANVIWKFGDGAGQLFAGTLNQAGSSQGELGYGRLNNPQQIAIGPNSSVVIADRGNQQLRVASCAGVITVLAGTDPADWFTGGPPPEVEPGWWDSPKGPLSSELREPVGMATDAAGNVYDTELYYHLVRGASGALPYPGPCSIVGSTSGTNGPPIVVLNPISGFFPNGVTITISASNSVSGFSRDTRLFYRLDGLDPTMTDTEILIDSNGQARLPLEGPIDLAKLRVRAFIGTVGGPVAAATTTQVPTPVIRPDSGYYPMGADIIISSTNGFPDGTLLYYTLDGSIPTTNSTALDHDGTSAVLSWNDALHDLRSLKVRAFLGPNEGSVAAGRAVSFPGEPTIQGEIGVPPARNGYKAGIGSYYVLPIVANLRDRQKLLSLQFVIELSPIGNAPHLDRTDLQVLQMSTNDFIQVLPASTLPPDSTFSTARNGTNRLAIIYYGTNAGFNVTAGYATVALLGIQFRAEDALGNQASFGDAYKLRITQLTGTSDGVQNLLPLKPMDDITIQFQNITFREGDTAPAYWYNAGDFGNGMLENGDVDRAIFAAFGFRRPFPLSDAFAAMDVYRVGVLENVVEYSDAATILRRSLGFESEDVFRVRDDSGEWGSGSAALTVKSRGLHALSAETPVWSRDVTIVGGVVDRVSSIQSVNVPVYMKVRAGANVSGMQFVADVVPIDGAPPVTAVTFVPAANIQPPRYGSYVPGLGELPNTVFARWDGLPAPVTGTVLLGYIQFVTPSTVLGGEHYNIVFHNTGGAAIDPVTGDLLAYLFQSVHGEVWPFQAAPAIPEISDDWKVHFFGSMDAASADSDADPDGDGLTNVEEYLAGTDPGTPDWRVKTQSGHVFFRWVGRAGKHYTVQSTSDLKNWGAVTGSMTGQDSLLQYDEPATPTARFYRLNIQ